MYININIKRVNSVVLSMLFFLSELYSFALKVLDLHSIFWAKNDRTIKLLKLYLSKFSYGLYYKS